MDDAIKRNGVALVLHRDTGSTENDYGDTTPTWGAVTLSATEYVWIQNVEPSGPTGAIPRRIDMASRPAFLMSFTEAQELDMIVVGSVKYRIERLREVEQYNGDTSHYEARIRLVEEG
jgi:hypothetical protein